MNELITQSSSFVVELAPSAYALKEQTLVQAGAVKEIDNDFAQQSAVDAMKEIRKFTKAVEESRKDAKRPAKEFAEKVDAIAKDACKELEAEYARIQVLASAYEIAKRKAAEEIERQRKAAEDKLEKERLALLAKQAEDRKKVIEASLNATTAEAAAKAEAELRAFADKGKKEREDTEAKQAALVAPKAAKIAGSRVQDKYVFTVVDIHALYAVRPDLVKLEPKTAEINKLINSGTMTLAGLDIAKELKVGV